MCAARAGSRGRVQPGSVAASVLSLLEGGRGSVTATQRELSRLCGRPASSVASDQMVIVDELALEGHMTKRGVVRMLLAEALEARGMTKGDK